MDAGHQACDASAESLTVGVHWESALLAHAFQTGTLDCNANRALAGAVWQSALRLLGDLHDRLWRRIACPADAYALLTIKGGSPRTLLAFADYARRSGAGFDRLVSGDAPNDDAYGKLSEAMVPPIRETPAGLVQHWRRAFFWKWRLESDPGHPDATVRAVADRRFQRCLDALAACTIVDDDDDQATSPSDFLDAFRDPVGIVRDERRPDGYPVELDSVVDDLDRAFLALGTITMGLDELSGDLQRGRPARDDLDRALLALCDRIQPRALSLLHSYPPEVLAIRSTRSLRAQVDEVALPLDLVARAIVQARARSGQRPRRGVYLYSIPDDYTRAVLASDLTALRIGHVAGPGEIAVRVATYDLFQRRFGRGVSFCGPAGTAWQLLQVLRLAGRPISDRAAAIAFASTAWQYMGALYHTRAEIVWVVALDAGLDPVDLYDQFERNDPSSAQ